MDKQTIEKILNNIIHKKNLQNTIITKCPTWLSKPTSADKKFLDTFFGGGEDSMENYRETDEDIYEDDVKVQQEFENDEGFSMDEKEVVADWGDCGFSLINGKLYNTEHFRNQKRKGFLDEEDIKMIDKNINILKKAIERGPDIRENSILFRGGHWDERIKVGDVITQKGFASLTYDEGEASGFADDDVSVSGSSRYLIEFYVPSKSKGIWLSEPFDNLDESEYLIPPNTRYYVFDVDEVNETAKVVILP